MDESANIVIGDRSALHMHLHCDGLTHIAKRQHAVQQQQRAAQSQACGPNSPALGDGEGAALVPSLSAAKPDSSPAVRFNPISRCATTADDLSSFNVDNPLYGEHPITVLVHDTSFKRRNETVEARVCSYDLPGSAFIRLREGLFATSPELTLARVALALTPIQVAQSATDLCGRYYLHPTTGEIIRRSEFATTPKRIREFLESVPGLYGASKALDVMGWIAPNSGSPRETIARLQFCLPLQSGGFALPTGTMNYDVKAGRLAHITEQRNYSIDLADPQTRTGLEYDGRAYHQAVEADQCRRNELAMLGWTIFPFGNETLSDPDATERLAYQVARHLKRRIQKPRCWEASFVRLRQQLGLPA